MSHTARTFWLAFLVVLIPAWFFQRWLEARGVTDVIGVGYTSWCAVFWSLVAATVTAIVSRIVMR